MSLSLVSKENIGRVVMVDVVELVNHAKANDFGYLIKDCLEDIIEDKIRDDQPSELLLSLLERGFTVPILMTIPNKYDDVPSIHNGHHRFALSLFCGFTEIPVFVSEQASEWDKSEDDSLPDYMSTRSSPKIEAELKNFLR